MKRWKGRRAGAICSNKTTTKGAAFLPAGAFAVSLFRIVEEEMVLLRLLTPALKNEARAPRSLIINEWRTRGRNKAPLATESENRPGRKQ